MTKHDHIRLVGILHVAWNLLGVLTGIGVFMLWLGFAGVAGAAAGADQGAGTGAAAAGVIGTLGAFIGCGVLLPSLPGFLGGWKLLSKRPWARWVVVIASVIHILTLIPISVVLGVYSLWVLLDPETAAIIEGSDWIPKG